MIVTKAKRRGGTLARFQEPVRDDLRLFRKRYRETLTSGHRSIDRVVNYLTRSHGKGLRPTLTMLSARLGSDKPSESTIRAAVIVELLHEATLVHDDVVDEATHRRGLLSLPARFRNKISVLFGDYMLANVLSETLSQRDMRWLDILADTSRRMARGELLEAAHSRRLDLTENDYLMMIGDKTAALFKACCLMGGLTGGLSDELLVHVGEYGENLGMAFQIRDDMLDIFGDGHLIGKPVGGDLKDKKLTLSLLGAMRNSSPREARRIRARIRRGVKRRDVKIITEFIRRFGGDVYAGKVMMTQSTAAKTALEPLPSSSIRDLMIELADFAVKRTR